MSMKSRKKKALGILSTLLLPMNLASYVPHNETTSGYTNFKANDLSDTTETFPLSSVPMPSNYTDDWSDISSVPMPSTYTDDWSDRLSTVQQDKQGQKLTFDNQIKKEEFDENLKNGVIKATANLLNSKRGEIIEEFYNHPLPTMQSKEFYEKKVKELRFYDQLENGIFKELIEYYPTKNYLKYMDSINTDRLDFLENLIDIIDKSKTQGQFSLKLGELLYNHYY